MSSAPDPETLFEGRYLTLKQRAGWEYVARRHRVAVLVAWTPDDALLLVEQFRIPIGRSTIELPAGLVGDEPGREDEALLSAAGRELEEETGWRAASLQVLIDCPVSAGMSDEEVVFVRAEDLTRVGSGGGDDSESIQVHAVALDQLDRWLRQRHREGLAIDPKIYAALYWRRFGGP